MNFAEKNEEFLNLEIEIYEREYISFEEWAELTENIKELSKSIREETSLMLNDISNHESDIKSYVINNFAVLECNDYELPEDLHGLDPEDFQLINNEDSDKIAQYILDHKEEVDSFPLNAAISFKIEKFDVEDKELEGFLQ